MTDELAQGSLEVPKQPVESEVAKKQSESGEEGAERIDDFDEEEVRRLEKELQMLQKMRLAFTSSLHMFEGSRRDLIELGNRMDRLRHASERCRKELAENKSQQANNQADS